MRRLHRSRTDRMLGGVCGGLGEYLGLDPTIVRLFFVLLALANGGGVLIYLILWIVLPAEGRESAGLEGTVEEGAKEIAGKAREMGEELGSAARQPHPQAGIYIGVALLLLGGFLLMRNLGVPWLGWLNSDLLWPLLLVVAGLALLLRRAEAGDE